MNKVSALDISLLSFTLCSFYWRTKKQWHELPLSLKWALVHHPLKKKKKLTVLCTFHTSATLHPTADHAEVIQFLHLAVLKGITLKQTPTAGEKTSADLFHGGNKIWLCVGSVWDCMLHSVLYVFPRVWLTCMWCLFIVPGALPASTHERTPSHMQFAGDV